MTRNAQPSTRDLVSLRKVPQLMGELVELPQWVVWRFEEREGQQTKVPYCAFGDQRASTKDHRTWCSFGQALARFESDSTLDGIGFVFDVSDPFCGIDLDDCLDEQRQLLPWARPIVEKLATYGEISPSGRGLKLFARAKLPGGRRRSGNVEMYDQRRYFTVTGSHFEGTPAAVEARQKEVEVVYAEFILSSAVSSTPARTIGDTKLLPEDYQLLEKARKARNGEKFRALFDQGDLSAYDQDDSRADLALCCLLAYWCSGDTDRIDRLFRASALMRHKWDSRRGESTYGAQTIERALQPGMERECNTEVPGARANKERKQAQILLELVDDLDLFHTPDGTGYASMLVNGHIETWKLDSKFVRQLLLHRFYDRQGKPPGNQALRDAIDTLEAKARIEGPEQAVHLRIVEIEGAIFLDLGDPEWRCVEVTARGWKVVDQCPVRFTRAPTMSSLPEPRSGRSLNELRHLVNLNEESFVLYVAFLVACLRPSGPFPILALQGEQGSAKSTAARIAKELIDPTLAPLRSAPSNEHDLILSANNSWLLTFDNLSGVPNRLSDALCRLSTGGGFATRELYSDDRERVFSATRPVLLNGIDDVLTRPDLLDRALVLVLEPIPSEQRKTSAEITQAFNEIRPHLLGALLEAVSCALKNYGTVQLSESPRMADFARWMVAAEHALPWESGTFIKLYLANISEAVETLLELDPLAVAVRDLLGNERYFEGTASDLAFELQAQTGNRWSLAWVKNPRSLSNGLRRITPTLRSVGISVSFHRSRCKDHKRLIVLEKLRKFASEASEDQVLRPQVAANTGTYGSDANRTQTAPSDARVQPSDANQLPSDANRTQTVEALEPLLSVVSDDADASDAKFPVFSRDEDISL